MPVSVSPAARRLVRSTWVARSRSPSLNHAGPPRRRQRLHEAPRLVAPAPAGLRVDEAGQACRASVSTSGEMCEAQMLEVVAGVDDDGQPLAQQMRQPQGQLGAADAARERNIAGGAGAAHRNRSSCLGPHQRGRRPRRGAPVEAAHQRGGPALGGLAHHQHRRGRHRIGEADLGDLQRPAGQVLLAAPIPAAPARRRRRWRARRCRAARPGRRCRR